jgi:LysM repeat protein
MIFIDHSLQKLLFDYAESIGEDPEWLGSVFRGRGETLPLIRHARGHATHLHVRFFNPKAQKLGQDLYPLLVKHEIVPHVDSFQVYRAKKGDTLEKLSRTFGVSVRELKRANGLKSSLLIAKQTYRIPRAHGVEPSHAPIVVPPRRVPPMPAKKSGPVPATGKSSGLGPATEESHDAGEPEDD